MPWERRTRSLMVRGVLVVALASMGSALMSLPGCGPGVGDVVTVYHPDRLYLDQELFKLAAQLKNAGSSRAATTEQYDEDRLERLPRWSKIRIIESVPGGYKVVVEESPEVGQQGRVGWITPFPLTGK